MSQLDRRMPTCRQFPHLETRIYKKRKSCYDSTKTFWMVISKKMKIIMYDVVRPNRNRDSEFFSTKSVLEVSHILMNKYVLSKIHNVVLGNIWLSVMWNYRLMILVPAVNQVLMRKRDRTKLTISLKDFKISYVCKIKITAKFFPKGMSNKMYECTCKIKLKYF